MPPNCWLKRRPLETGLFLVLSVAIPFFLVIVAMYVLLILQGCPNCSITCEEYCQFHKASSTTEPTRKAPTEPTRIAPTEPVQKTTAVERPDETIEDQPAARVLTEVFQIHPNISLTNLAEKHKTCPLKIITKHNYTVSHPFVASIIEDVFTDDVTEQQLLCAAAILSFKWLIASRKCIKKDIKDSNGNYKIFARAGSNYWNKQGSEHEINTIIIDSHSYNSALIELKIEFPKLPTIRPAIFSATSLFRNGGIAEIYGWRFSSLLKYKKKVAKIESESVILYKNNYCSTITKNPNLVCAVKVKPQKEACVHFPGSILVTGKILIGLNVEDFCDDTNNQSRMVHLIFEINSLTDWIYEVTGISADIA